MPMVKSKGIRYGKVMIKIPKGLSNKIKEYNIEIYLSNIIKRKEINELIVINFIIENMNSIYNVCSFKVNELAEYMGVSRQIASKHLNISIRKKYIRKLNNQLYMLNPFLNVHGINKNILCKIFVYINEDLSTLEEVKEYYKFLMKTSVYEVDEMKELNDEQKKKIKEILSIIERYI